MNLNTKKYDHIEFHGDLIINNKIKAYMVIFDYQVLVNKLDEKEKVNLFNEWERVFLDEEFYEIIPCIKYRKKKLLQKIKSDRLSVINRVAYKLSDIIQNLINKKG